MGKAEKPPPGRKFLEAHTGDRSQFAGVKRYRLEEGRAAGASFADVWTASGLAFTVALDRALDITEARHRGRSLCWRSPAGDAAPGLFDPYGLGWLRTFPGGLVATCGLTHTGGPAEVDGEQFGLHGRISNTPAEEVACRTRWAGDELEITVSGRVRQAVLFGEKLELRRTIRTTSSASHIEIEDVVENTSHARSPLMLMYHVNAGYPVVEDGSKLLLNAAYVEPMTQHTRDGLADYADFHGPEEGYEEKVYFITPEPNARGENFAAVVNSSRDFGLYLKWYQEELPALVEWKMLGHRDYVVGVEPCTVHDRPRREVIERGEMPWIGPGELREFHLELGALGSGEEVEDFSASLKK